jgi:hypothetical protein
MGVLARFLVAAVCAAAIGCHAQPAKQGTDRELVATYKQRELTADLPGNVRVPSVAAAAESALRHRGYSVTLASKTEDYARVEAEPPNAGLFERVIVRARQTPSKTRVEIVAEPLGDQTLSRSLLDEMLAGLGM